MHEPRSVSVCARCLKPCVSVHVRSPGGSPVCRRSYISSHIFQLLDRGFLAVHASLVNWLHSCQLRAVQQNVKSRNENRAVLSGVLVERHSPFSADGALVQNLVLDFLAAAKGCMAVQPIPWHARSGSGPSDNLFFCFCWKPTLENAHSSRKCLWLGGL